MLTRFYLPISRQVRRLSTKQKVKLSVTLDEDTCKKFDTEEMKPRKHPGKDNVKLADLPTYLPVAVTNVLTDMPVTNVIADATRLANFLNGRHPPAEENVVKDKYFEIQAELVARKAERTGSEVSYEDLNDKEKRRGVILLKRAIHAWSPVNYNKYASLLYLISRSAQEYAVLRKIFHAIKTRDANFHPQTFMDFGSGVGTALWAMSETWPDASREHMNIDSSTEMNNLSEFIVGHAEAKFEKIFYRQYIPLSNRTYDVVVSAYSLLELPNMQTRLDSIGKLWAKTERYLVIVEQGTNAGFRMVIEARDFILHMERSQNKNRQSGIVFAPCPHDSPCPRYRDDITPCNFETRYKPLGLKNAHTPGVERFSYVVLKKGEMDDHTRNWPRIVRPVLPRSGHVICRLCTSDGNLNEIIFTKSKHGKWMYRCAKGSNWGDRLPIETEIDATREEIPVDTEMEAKKEEDEDSNDEEEEDEEDKEDKEDECEKTEKSEK